MVDKRKQYINNLTEFKLLIQEYGWNPSPNVRTAIVKSSSLVQKLVSTAKAGRTITITPPPAVGGYIIHDANPFDLIFQNLPGVDVIGTIVDCIDEAIGNIEGNEHFSIDPKPLTQPSVANKEDLVTRVTVTKEVSKILGMSQEAFWPLIVTIIGAAFYLGHLVGQTKFDQEKIDLYNSNQTLNWQNQALDKQLGKVQYDNRKLSDSLKESQEQAKNLRDSVKSPK